MADNPSPDQNAPSPKSSPASPPQTPQDSADKKFTSTEQHQIMTPTKSSTLPTVALAATVVLFGIASGFGLSRIKATNSTQSTPQTNAPADSDQITVGETYGMNGEIFTDQAEGIIIKGGIDGEGAHRLLRPGGESQIICLTSSILDLDLFIDHQVSIWGETFDTQKCGWFMDVGRVKVEELKAQKPFKPEE